MKRERAIAMSELGQCLEYPHTKVSKTVHLDLHFFSYNTLNSFCFVF